nr:hypothetical protein [Tanacetum cinerariifolium]
MSAYSFYHSYGCSLYFHSCLFSEESDGDTIEFGVDIVHPRLNTLIVFLVSTIVVKLAQHEEELRVQRDRAKVAEEERSTLCARIRSWETVETILRNTV